MHSHALPVLLPASACPADPRYRGVRGVVVRDTVHTLQLVTPDSRLLVVPKAVRWRRLGACGGRMAGACSSGRPRPAVHAASDNQAAV